MTWNGGRDARGRGNKERGKGLKRSLLVVRQQEQGICERGMRWNGRRRAMEGGSDGNGKVLRCSAGLDISNSRVPVGQIEDRSIKAAGHQSISSFSCQLPG